MSATAKASRPSGMLAAGIYADMSIDGPEIGTLVVVVDRAKNLPNRRTMGKQNPYCACRLGKDAKKTETDKRGGQVPRWDQELRFVVRESPDYYSLKVSIFNDDKKTELIGESWLDLTDVVKPGGGQNDLWHNLNCKGKYAGEVRLELTYYDSRPKPDRLATEEMEDMRNSSGPASSRQTPIKRRPLPTDPMSVNGSPADGRPMPVGARSRDFGTPPRPLPQRSTGSTPGSQRRTMPSSGQPQPVEPRQPSQEQYFDEQSYAQDPYQMPPAQYDSYPAPEDSYQQSAYPYDDNPITGLPELPPMTSTRRQPSNRPSRDTLRTGYGHAPPRQPPLLHAHSAPQVPVQQIYDEVLTNPRDAMHPTHSDSQMYHGQPSQLHQYDPYQEQQGLHQFRPQEVETQASYPYLNPSQPEWGSTIPESYGRRPHDGMYGRPADNYQQPPVEQYQIGAPAPPSHRESAPNSAARNHYTGYAPAPLNVTPIRRSPSPLAQQTPDSYGRYPQDAYDAEHGGRRNTDPMQSSPIAQADYRPRAMSGDAIRSAERFHARDDVYALPPSHPDYHSPVTGVAQEFPEVRSMGRQRRESYQPAQRSPLAEQSPLSARDDLGSFPSQQSTPSHVANRYQHSAPPSAHNTPGRPFYAQHHHSANEPQAPQILYQTPPRTHPLAQQVAAHSSPRDLAPMVRPIALPMKHTPASEPRMSLPASRSTPAMRRSLSPRPGSSGLRKTPSAIFSPDSFEQFNPAARSSSSLINHPATSSHGTPTGEAPPPLTTKDGKIVDFHGNHIDPSDRLPEHNWAPEPDPKATIQEKPYREREKVRGARDLSVTLTTRASPRTGESTPAESPSSGGRIRARLVKKDRPTSSIALGSVGTDRPINNIPNLPATHRSPGAAPPMHFADYNQSAASLGYTAGGGDKFWAAGGSGHTPSPLSAKLPMESQHYNYGHADTRGNHRHSYSPQTYSPQANLPGGGAGGEMDALTREMSSIDIGFRSSPAAVEANNAQRFSRSRLLGFRS